MSGSGLASSGVRNLRAMFESGNDPMSPPPARGRSPVGSEGVTSNGSTTPRPLSKVRASFVAVERSGALGTQLGLRRSNEEPGASSGVPKSYVNDTTSLLSKFEPKSKEDSQKKEDKKAEPEYPRSDDKAAFGSPQVEPLMVASKTEDSMGETAGVATEAKTPERKSGTVASRFESLTASSSKALESKSTEKNQSPKKVGRSLLRTNEQYLDSPSIAASIPLPETPKASKKTAPVVDEEELPKKPNETDTLIEKSEQEQSSAEIDSAAEIANPFIDAPLAQTSAAIEPVVSLSPHNIAGTAPAAPPAHGARSSTRAKPVEKPKAISTKEPSKRQTAGKKPSATAPSTSRSGPRSSLAQSTKPLPGKVSAAPLSPTISLAPRLSNRPSRASILSTMGTASSMAKTSGNAPNATSRPSSRANTTSLQRQPSTLAQNSGRAMAPSQAPLGRGSSTLAPRTSAYPPLGKPSQKPLNSNEASNPKLEKTPDEGFLARMMRPTASSARRLHDKLDGKSPPQAKSLGKGAHTKKPARPGHDGNEGSVSGRTDMGSIDADLNTEAPVESVKDTPPAASGDDAVETPLNLPNGLVPGEDVISPPAVPVEQSQAVDV
ncbi:MAG: hypothetical protein M1829_004496 [Trizodia sp. TS-e1964]|nr:MAG: hypothetical protein M1829_004496 [Trizodia sp. TS-e1964]